MGHPAPETTFSAADYLVWEAAQTGRHEFHDGEVNVFRGKVVDRLSLRAGSRCGHSHHLGTKSNPARERVLSRRTYMRTEYDLSKLKSRKNPYASKLKKPVTMRLSEDVVLYFKGMADEAGVPYQSLINLYLRDCLANHRKVQINWPQTV